MKVLFVLDCLRTGGRERRFIELVKYLKESTTVAFSVVLFEEEIHYEYYHKLEIKTYYIKRSKRNKDPRIFKDLYRICKDENPDFIHTWSNMTTFYSLPLKFLLNKHIISSQIADTLGFDDNLFHKFILKINLMFVDRIVSNSFAGLQSYGIKNGKSEVIYNGVDLKRFTLLNDKLNIRNKLSLQSYKSFIIMVGSISRFKNYDLLLDVVKSVNVLNKEICFLVLGDGPLENHIKERINSESIQNVFLLGRRENVEDYIKMSDIGILLTYKEGISNSIIEYMALAKPVITNDLTGGTSELVINHVTGYITSNDINEITKRISSLVSDKSLINIMGIAGQNRIINHFSIEKMAKKYLDLYNKISS